VVRKLRINDRHCLLSLSAVFVSNSQYTPWNSSWKHDEKKTHLDALVSDVHLGCLMTIGSTVSSFALFRARKRDLTDEGSEAWTSCRQTDRQPEMVGHVHVVLGLALPAGAILAEYKVVLQLGVHWVYVSSIQFCVFVVCHSCECWYYSVYCHRLNTAAPKHPVKYTPYVRWDTAVCCGNNNNNNGATRRKVAVSIPDGVIGIFY